MNLKKGYNKEGSEDATADSPCVLITFWVVQEIEGWISACSYRRKGCPETQGSLRSQDIRNGVVCSWYTLILDLPFPGFGT